MSDLKGEDLTRKNVGFLMLAWVEEIIRISELLRVLYRSVSYSQFNGNKSNSGDERLIQHIQQSRLQLVFRD